MSNTKHQIRCKGRWSVHGHIPCEDKFEYFGSYGDQPLISHQEKEKSVDCKKHWWTGFENDQKFDQLRYNAYSEKALKLDLDNVKNKKR